MAVTGKGPQEVVLKLRDLNLPKIEVSGARYSTVRIFQPGAKLETKPEKFDFSGNEWEFKVPVIRGGLPWLIVEFRTKEQNTESKKMTQQTKAMFTVPLRTGTYKVPVYDPSLQKKNSDSYKDLGTAKVDLVVPFETPRYMQRLQQSSVEMFRLALLERDQSVEIWIRDFQERVPNQALLWYYLQQYTTKMKDGITPAYYFIEMARLVPPATKAYIDHLYKSVAEIYGKTVQDIEDMLTNPEGMTDTQMLLAHRIMADILTIPANAHFYVSDHAGFSGVERFSMGCFEGLVTGDCEDLGMVAVLVFYSLLKSKDTPSGLSDFLMAFRPMLVTGAATNKKMDLRVMKGGFICHVWALFIPEVLVAKWKGVEPSARHTEKWHKRLYPILGEGTNFADPLGMEIPFYIKDSKTSQYQEISRIDKLIVNNAEVASMAPVLKDRTPIRFAPLDKEIDDPEMFSRFYCYAFTAWSLGHSRDVFLGDDNAAGEPRVHHFVMEGDVGVQPYYVLRGDPRIRLEPHRQAHMLDEDQRAILVSINGAPGQLSVNYDEPIVVDERGEINRDNMAEFRFKHMAELGNTKPWELWENYKLIKVSVAKGIQVFILQVTP